MRPRLFALLRLPSVQIVLGLSLLALALLTAFLPRPDRLAVAVHTIRPSTQNLTNAAALDVDAVVQVFPWREVEPTEGRFFWLRTDETVAGAAYYGMDLYVRLDQPPTWAAVADPQSGEPPFDPVAYARFVEAVANRYAGKVTGYILWNEPNLALEWNGLPPDPAAYVRLLSAGAQAVRRADPDALVISAGLASTNTVNEEALDDRLFLEAMYQAGAAPLFDGLGAHPYGFGLPPETAPHLTGAAGESAVAPVGDLAGLLFRRVEVLREIMVANGDGQKSIFATEMGWSVEPVAHSGWQRVSLEAQASYIEEAIRFTQEQWPWLALITVWNVGGEDDPSWRGYSLLDPAGEPRPAYHRLADLMQERSGGNTGGNTGRNRGRNRGGNFGQRLFTDVFQPSTASALASPYQVLADDVTIHLGDAEMPEPWVPIYRGRAISPHWQGTVYLTEADLAAGQTAWRLTATLMQSNFWSNQIWINGVPLEAPAPLDNFTKSWVRHSWPVPVDLLTPGPNSVGFTVSHSVPLIQAQRFAYDEVQIRDIVLARE